MRWQGGVGGQPGRPAGTKALVTMRLVTKRLIGGVATGDGSGWLRVAG